MNDAAANTTVLIVEDDPLFSSLLCHMVETLGFRVVARARDGFEAVAVCRAIEPDLVLMDIVMPRLNGIDAGTLIRSAQDTPIIFVSGFGLDEFQEKALDALSGGFLRKPFTLAELRIALSHFKRERLEVALP